MRISIHNKRDDKKIKQFVSENLEDIFHSPAKDLEDLEDIGKNFELLLIAKENKEIVGTLGIKNENGIARISRMYVKKSERGRGIGERLMKKALNYCKKKFSEVILTTYKQMNSVGFYERMGFKIFKSEADVFWMKIFLTK